MFDAKLRRISVCLFKVLQLCQSFLFITLSAQLINSDMLRYVISKIILLLMQSNKEYTALLWLQYKIHFLLLLLL